MESGGKIIVTILFYFLIIIIFVILTFHLMKKYNDEIIFCARYLKDRGVTPKDYEKIERSCEPPKYELVKIDRDFYVDLAKELRKLWPPGDKDGKWPWRDSVSNLAQRIRLLWTERRLDGFTMEECLSAARKYLARFEDDVKYMQILKYFILKQKVVKFKNESTVVYESTFADILEGKKDYDTIDNEWNDALNSCLGEGELI